MRMTYRSVSRGVAALVTLIAIGACHHGGATMTPAASGPRNTPANPTTSAARRGLPNGVTALMVAQGDSLFHARSCKNCHGADAHGATNGPNLTTGKFMHVNGSYDDFVRLITSGVPADSIKDPSHHIPMGGRGAGRGAAPFTDEQVRAVAAYVYALNHP
jgi:mono/diheme cytochrome c family protein